ncbi:MAG TPA: amino acid ABC transporter substrate-binding protein [Ramlibacter sp.]|nr:amino acid ABC transporter substrate-binding protein [Ramlibacter sp.]
MRPISMIAALGLSACSLLAVAPASAADALQRISERGQVNIGFADDSPPYSFKDDKGHAAGYSIDLCGLVVERLRQELGKPNLRVKMLHVATDQMARLVGNGGVDLMCAGVSDTPERRATMSFSTPIFLSDVKLMVRTKDGFKTAADLKGKSVAVLGRTTTEAAVRAYSARAGVPLQVSRVVNADAALSQLRLAHAAAWARDETLLLGVMGRHNDKQDFMLLPDKLATEPIAIALQRDAGLQRVVDQALALAVRSGKVEALYDQWFVKPNRANPNGLKLALSPALKAEFDRLR